jgi:hypothetical protein
LAEQEKAKGGEQYHEIPATGSELLPVVPTLAERGVTKTQSAKWQNLAALHADRARLFTIGERHQKVRQLGVGAMRVARSHRNDTRAGGVKG